MSPTAATTTATTSGGMTTLGSVRVIPNTSCAYRIISGGSFARTRLAAAMVTAVTSAGPTHRKASASSAAITRPTVFTPPQAMAASLAAHASRESRDEGRAKLLVCRDVDVHYGQVQILFNVDFDVDDGEIVALLGTNGAGKSTLLRAISGLTPPSNGAIFCDGEDITQLPAHEHAERGIVMVSGGKGVFPTLTVGENLKLAAWKHRQDDEYVAEATGTPALR